MLKPTASNILVRVPKEEETMKENTLGIIIPDSVTLPENEDMRRVIVDIGPDVDKERFAKDQMVLLTQLSMREKYHEGDETYEVIKPTDILGHV